MTYPTVAAGPYVVGEKPPALAYTFKDSQNIAINLTGFTAKFIVKHADSSAVTYNATVTTPASGIVSYTWTGAEFPLPGSYQAEFWAGNGTSLRYCSVMIKFEARLPVGPVPSV